MCIRDRVFRTLCINGQQVPNVLFLDLDVEVLLALTYPAEELCEETTAEQKSGGYPTKISDTPGEMCIRDRSIYEL